MGSPKLDCPKIKKKTGQISGSFSVSLLAARLRGIRDEEDAGDDRAEDDAEDP